MRVTMRLRLAGAFVLLAGGVGGPALLGAGTAQAVVCGPAIAAGTPCTLTGTLGVTAGTLTLTSPTALAWATTASGIDQQLVDPATAHQSYLVNDASASALGWHVTVSATTFTTGTLVLPNAGTFLTTGSVTSEAAATPTAACSSGSTCTLPTNATTYPVAITTAASPTPVNIYGANAATGIGSITIGIGANPVGWWVNVPGRTLAGTYLSTVTLQIISGP